MENTFVSYLNSMNNAGSDTVAALAEAQVLNKYYSQIKIERKLGRYISDRIRSGEKDVYILTGHAGDGKTAEDILKYYYQNVTVISAES